jgi:hypothetical protein
MITEQEALRSVDPNLSEEERIAAAQRIMMGDAAYCAYLDSRSPLERIIAEAQKEALPTHAELQADAPPEQGKAIDATASEVSPEQTEHEAQLAAARERVAELEAA